MGGEGRDEAGGVTVPYATPEDLRTRYGSGELDRLLDEGCDGEPDRDRVEMALSDASAEIDSTLARAFGLPLPAGGYPALRAICCDLARQRLYDDAPTGAVSNKARRARALLKAIGEGVADLTRVDAEDNSHVVQRRALAPAHAGPAPVMTDRNLAGF